MAHESLHHTSTSTSFANALVHNQYNPYSSQSPNPNSPIKLVAAEAGFLPPGPATDFADMLQTSISNRTRTHDCQKSKEHEKAAACNYDAPVDRRPKLQAIQNLGFDHDKESSIPEKLHRKDQSQVKRDQE